MLAIHSRQLRSRTIDLTGQRFARWVVLAFHDYTSRGSARWLCLCGCGERKVVDGSSLRSGRSKSCGCFRREAKTHGQCYTKIYFVWSGMRARCRNPKAQDYKNYGGRGIRVCERWEKFENFLADMGEAPSGTTLDRVDVNGDYEKSNCRWATRRVQARNQRRTVMLTFDGRSQSRADWADELGIKHATLTSRLRNGWSVEQALTGAVRIGEQSSRKTLFGLHWEPNVV